MESEIEELCRGVIEQARHKAFDVKLQRLAQLAAAILASQIPLTTLEELTKAHRD